jgi:Tfp pilus assembly protein PilW
MKWMNLRIGFEDAFSLVEMMLSLTVGGFLLGGLILGFSTFQQVFAGVDDYYRATSDQMRVLDFIGQDMHRATSGTVSNSTTTLTLTLPDYIDESQNPPIPRTATLGASGTVTYGTSGVQPTAVYTISGTTPNQVITRTYTPTTGSATTTTLTMAAASYQFNCLNPTNAGSTANFSFGGVGQPSSVLVKISFQPKFNRLNLTNARTATTISSTILLRNHL